MFSSALHLRLLVIAVALCYANSSKAASQSDNSFFPLAPRLSLSAGTGDNTYGHVDVMAPLFGSTNGIVYTDIEGQAGKGKSWFGSVGVGGRAVVSQDEMWGGYVFLDRSRSIDIHGGNEWTVFNPGVEFMTNRWDGRVNGYIPSGRHREVMGTYFGDQVDMPDAVSFNGHNQYSLLFDQIEEIGSGADMDAGYTFTRFHRWRLHGGSYYFKTAHTGDINGVEGGVEAPLNPYLTLEFNDSYDNAQKNTGIISLRFTLGGIHKSYTPVIQDRLLDPIHRHFGSLSTSAAIPSNNEIVASHTNSLERSDIWFFDANSNTAFNAALGDQNCTYEHPCNGQSFNQNTIDAINNLSSHANFYFLPGTYALSSGDTLSHYGLDSQSNRVSLEAGQSMYGRMNHYALPASAGSYPTFTGGLDPQGNNTLDSFALVNNNGMEAIGMHVLNASHVVMNNLQIGAQNSTQTYQNPVVLDNAQDVTLQNSTINGTLTGIQALNHSTATINNNTVTLVTPSTSKSVEETIDAENASVLDVNNNAFSITSPSGATNEIGGILSQSNATVNANDNAFTLSHAFEAEGLVTMGGTINANDNTFIINSQFSTGMTTTGLVGAIHADGNTFTLTAPDGGVIWGIANNGSSTVTATHNTFHLSGNSLLQVVGIVNSGSASSMISNNNIFTFSGASPVNHPCSSGAYTGSGNVFTGFTGTCN